ncbi:DUF3102 domain-containing protein [Ruoffia sp. FAM 26254]|uniref:DUF3102 domain-containing protein n=1 Tax=Ruoffia sp. FAM 26254 TaxID=3259518 RepID=UPI003889EE4E
MNQLMLSSNLNVIESEIKMFKESMGRSIWEIGRRLNHVKEQDLMHGEFIDWLNTVGIERRKASRMMRIAKELPENETTLSHLGLSALDLIASLPEESRHTPAMTRSGAIKPPIDMTVRELKEMRSGLNTESEPGKPTQEVIQPPRQREQDRLHIETLEYELESMKMRFAQVNQQYEDVLQREEESKEKADQLDTLKRELNQNKTELGKIESQIASTLDLHDLKRTVDTLLITISPMKYHSTFKASSNNMDLHQKFEEIVTSVSQWCEDMYGLLHKSNIIEADFEEYDY